MLPYAFKTIANISYQNEQNVEKYKKQNFKRKIHQIRVTINIYRQSFLWYAVISINWSIISISHRFEEKKLMQMNFKSCVFDFAV